MSKMDELKEKAADAALSAAKTAKFMANVSKRRVEIAMEKEHIHRIYARLGKIYYKDYVTDEEPDEAEYGPLCEEISDAFSRINTLKDEIKELKDEFFERKKKEAEETEELLEEDIFEETVEAIEE